VVARHAHRRVLGVPPAGGGLAQGTFFAGLGGPPARILGQPAGRGSRPDRPGRRGGSSVQRHPPPGRRAV